MLVSLSLFLSFFVPFISVTMHNGVDLPREGPHISGEKSQYQIGDTLNINCTSGKSHPSSSIQFFVNDEQVGCLFDNRSMYTWTVQYHCSQLFGAFHLYHFLLFSINHYLSFCVWLVFFVCAMLSMNKFIFNFSLFQCTISHLYISNGTWAIAVV